MNKALFLFLVVFAIISSCNNSGSSNSNSSKNQTENSTESTNDASVKVEREKTPDELRSELEQQENENPSDYLSVSFEYSKNIWGDKFKLDCKISNSASIAIFKDAIISVRYYSKTNTVLKTNKYMIYEVFYPNTEKMVNLTIDNYQNVDYIKCKIVDAKAV